jgi:hypothetical protein
VMEDYKITTSMLILISLATVLIKNHVLLIYCMLPLIVISDFFGLIPTSFSIGDAHIRIYDIVIFVIGIKVMFFTIASKQRIYKHPAYTAIGIFLGMLLGATFVTYYRFDYEIFIGELIAFIRLLAQVSVLFLLTFSIRKARQLETSKFVDYIGYFIAGSIYLDFVLFLVGSPLGEVIVSEDIVRYFGPIGDQVGFILIFFIFKSMIDNNLASAIFLSGGLIATGTRGAIFSLAAGFFVLVFQLRKNTLITRKRVLLLFTVMSVTIGTMILINFGTMLTRFTGYHFEPGVTQRFILARLAFQVFIDNFLTGVGYTGFRYLALDYGAWQIFTERLYFSPVFLATAGNQYLQVATDGGIPTLLSFVWMMMVFLRTFKTGAMRAQGTLQSLCLSGYVWLMSLLIGNQSAAWLLPGSLISYLMWIILGLAIANEQNCPGMQRKYWRYVGMSIPSK